MGILKYFGLHPAKLTAPDPIELAAPIFASLARDIDNMSVEQLWREQPHLRTVVDFIARNVSSVNLHLYRRTPDGGRERVRPDDRSGAGDIARMMKRANAQQLMSHVLYRSLADYCLYDEFVWIVDTDKETGAPRITPIPPQKINRFRWIDDWTLRSMLMTDETTGQVVEVEAAKIVRMHGYAPLTMKKGETPVEALKDTLREQLEAASYRHQLWRNGPRLGGVILRPKDAPDWDSRARRRFKQSWQAQYSGRGSGSGGTPVLEDGMTYQPQHLKAHDEEVVDMTKLSLQTVASIFQVNPTMIGLLDNANYSNVREFRKSLYGDSLAPQVKMIEDALNEFVLPILGASDDLYIEFNLEEKLRASFEEKAAVTSAAVGGPWMTVNEARAMNNMPALDGGDDLIRPLNVGTASDDTDEQDDPTTGDTPAEVEADGGGEDA